MLPLLGGSCPPWIIPKSSESEVAPCVCGNVILERFGGMARNSGMQNADFRFKRLANFTLEAEMAAAHH